MPPRRDFSDWVRSKTAFAASVTPFIEAHGGIVNASHYVDAVLDATCTPRAVRDVLHRELFEVYVARAQRRVHRERRGNGEVVTPVIESHMPRMLCGVSCATDDYVLLHDGTVDVFGAHRASNYAGESSTLRFTALAARPTSKFVYAIGIDAQSESPHGVFSLTSNNVRGLEVSRLSGPHCYVDIAVVGNAVLALRDMGKVEVLHAHAYDPYVAPVPDVAAAPKRGDDVFSSENDEPMKDASVVDIFRAAETFIGRIHEVIVRVAASPDGAIALLTARGTSIYCNVATEGEWIYEHPRPNKAKHVDDDYTPYVVDVAVCADAALFLTLAGTVLKNNNAAEVTTLDVAGTAPQTRTNRYVRLAANATTIVALTSTGAVHRATDTANAKMRMFFSALTSGVCGVSLLHDGAIVLRANARDNQWLGASRTLDERVTGEAIIDGAYYFDPQPTRAMYYLTQSALYTSMPVASGYALPTRNARRLCDSAYLIDADTGFAMRVGAPPDAIVYRRLLSQQDTCIDAYTHWHRSDQLGEYTAFVFAGRAQSSPDDQKQQRRMRHGFYVFPPRDVTSTFDALDSMEQAAEQTVNTEHRPLALFADTDVDNVQPVGVLTCEGDALRTLVATRNTYTLDKQRSHFSESSSPPLRVVRAACTTQNTFYVSSHGAAYSRPARVASEKQRKLEEVRDPEAENCSSPFIDVAATLNHAVFLHINGSVYVRSASPTFRDYVASRTTGKWCVAIKSLARSHLLFFFDDGTMQHVYDTNLREHGL